MTWAPLYTFSCYHGATSVIIGNCSLALGPVRRGNEERLAKFLSYVEAIPMEVLRSINVTWETKGEYMDTFDKRLGVNVGTLIKHSAVRHYVMGNDCQGRAATSDEVKGQVDTGNRRGQGKGIIDAFMDLVIEENLDMVFLRGASDVDKEALATILNYPNAYSNCSGGNVLR